MTGRTDGWGAALTPRVFRALFRHWDLRTEHGTHVAVPEGTTWFASPDLAEVARQISDHQEQNPGKAVPQ